MSNQTIRETIVEAGPFIQEACLTQLDTPKGNFFLEFRSRLTSAKDPNAWQRNFSTVLTRKELESLSGLLGNTLAAGGHQ